MLYEFKRLLQEASGHPAKKWLKSFEVRNLLNISPNTLANLRINGTLTFTKIGNKFSINHFKNITSHSDNIADFITDCYGSITEDAIKFC